MVNNASVRQTDEAWFAEELSYITKESYQGTTFHKAKLLNLVTGERKWIILPVDEFYVGIRDIGFEVVNLKCCKELGWKDCSLDDIDLTIDTGITRIDGNLGAMAMDSAKLHQHLDQLYN